jgi:RHS repeat-associated protein
VQSALYVFDEQGRRAHKRVFEAFGGVFAEVSSESTPREFGTHPFDASLGLYYMKARFYDPSVGRFTSLDPVVRDPAAVESANPYSYTENNPVNRIDPNGAFFVGGGEGLPAGECCGSSGGLGGLGLPPLGNPNGTVSGTFGGVRVTVTTSVNLPPTALDRIFRPSIPGSPKIQIPDFGGGVIVLDRDSVATIPGVIFADDNPTVSVSGPFGVPIFSSEGDPQGTATFLDAIAKASAEGGSVEIGKLLDAGNIPRDLLGVVPNGDQGPNARGDLVLASKADGRRGTVSNVGVRRQIPVVAVLRVEPVSVRISEKVSANFQLTDKGVVITNIGGVTAKILGLPIVPIKSIAIEVPKPK